MTEKMELKNVDGQSAGIEQPALWSFRSRLRIHGRCSAASGIPEFDDLMAKAQAKAPARSLVSIDDVGKAVAFLALDGAKLMTGDTIYIDGGYHIID